MPGLQALSSSLSPSPFLSPRLASPRGAAAPASWVIHGDGRRGRRTGEPFGSCKAPHTRKGANVCSGEGAGRGGREKPPRASRALGRGRVSSRPPPAPARLLRGPGRPDPKQPVNTGAPGVLAPKTHLPRASGKQPRRGPGRGVAGAKIPPQPAVPIGPGPCACLSLARGCREERGSASAGPARPRPCAPPPPVRP